MANSFRPTLQCCRDNCTIGHQTLNILFSIVEKRFMVLHEWRPDMVWNGYKFSLFLNVNGVEFEFFGCEQSAQVASSHVDFSGGL